MSSRNMKSFGILCVIICSFWSIAYAKKPAELGCLEKEKAITLLETAENLLLKATELYPSCKENSNSTDEADCENEKSLAYIEVSKKLISEVRENFPSCLKPIVDDNKNKTNDDANDGDDNGNDGNDNGNGGNDNGNDDIQYETARDCSEILAHGHNKSGVYTIKLLDHSSNGKPLQVYCDMKTDDGGWTVIQRRGKYPVQQDFNLDWDSYKNGFGNLTEEFWLGNENIYLLCVNGCQIRFDLIDYKGVYRYALYQRFTLAKSYHIAMDDYSGNTTDAMEKHNGNPFSTKDHDFIGRAKEYQSGWWHGKLFYCNLNGIYELGAIGPQHVYWWKDSDDYYNLRSVEMKVKPTEI